MKSGGLTLPVVTLAFVCSAAVAIADEIGDEFQERAEKKVAELRETAARSGGALRLYPKEVRHAILEVCSEPALIVRLADAEGSGPERLDAIVKGHAEEVDDAARALAHEQEVLSILTANLVMVGILGALYEDDPKGIQRLLDERASKEERVEKEALSDWQKRLEDDPEAMKEMEAATNAYQEEVGGSADEASASGTTTTESGTTVVYAAPSYSYTVYVVNRCDVYWHLCGNMYWYSYRWASYYDDRWDDYWDHRHAARKDWQNWMDEAREDRQEFREERREDLKEHLPGIDEPGNGGMHEAMKDWKEKNGDALPKDFFKDDGKLSERFRDYGEGQRDFRKGLENGRYKEGDRQKVLRNSVSEGRAGREGRASREGRAGKAPSRTRDRQAPSSAGRVERGEMSRDQRMDRARGAHRSSWGSQPRHGSPSRGGGYRGGGHRGGGRRGGGGRR